MLGEIVEDRYRIEAELGEGAMGRVYRARHVKVGREVALKVMHRDHASVPAIVERFAREAMIAARLRHPNVVAVLDVGTMPDRSPMIVLELAPGRKLSQLVDGPLARERVIAIVRQLLCGLEHAHAAGLIHRDLKPDNILVETAADGAEIPRIVDFGIAVTRMRDDSVAGRRITEANTIIGTPFYMSPEQALGKELDERSDLFSLGVIVYELLAGMLPFEGATVDVVLASLAKEPPAIAERAGVAVDPLLEAFARKLMARRPQDRFQSAREALVVLELIERDRLAATKVLAATNDALATRPLTIEPPTIEPPTIEPPTSEPSRAWPLRAIAVAVAAAFVAAIALALSLSTAQPLRGIPVAPLDTASGDEAEVSHRLVQREDAAPRGDEVAERAVPVWHVPRRAAVASPAVVVVAPAREVVAPAVAHDHVAPGDSARDVAARYIAVGKALRGAPDELWQRYRRIRINDALTSAESRRAALEVLVQIERALR